MYSIYISCSFTVDKRIPYHHRQTDNVCFLIPFLYSFHDFCCVVTRVPQPQADMCNYKYVEAKENVYLIKFYEQTEVCKKLEHQLGILFVWFFARNKSAA